MRVSFPVAILPVILLTSCNTPVEDVRSGGVLEDARTDGVMEIKFRELRQEIDGFGGSNAWTGLPSDITAAGEVVRLLYSKTEGAGFTMLRNRIPFRERLSGDSDPGLDDKFVVRKADNTYDYTESNGVKTFKLNWNAWDISNTRNLISRIKGLGIDGPEALTVMSTPWTPPNNRVTQWKENVTGVSAMLDYTIEWARPEIWGRLKKDKYSDYADLLADYVRDFEEKMGAPLAVLSVQNEPNWKVEYESAYMTGTEIRDFLKVMGQRFPQKGITPGVNGPGIMAPEYENFDIDFNAMIQPSLDDPASNSVLTHIGMHQYNGAHDSTGLAGAKAFPRIGQYGKCFWQTEVSGSGPYMPAGIGIDNALFYAKMIHHDMTLAGTNAFLFWWLWSGDAAGSLITVNGNTVNPALRLYAMGQYSRFIRPGWHRVASTISPIGGVYSSVYRSPAADKIAVVLINDTASDMEITLNLDGLDISSLEIWRTSASYKLEPVGTQDVTGQKAGVNLPPKSVNTLFAVVSG